MPSIRSDQDAPASRWECRLWLALPPVMAVALLALAAALPEPPRRQPPPLPHQVRIRKHLLPVEAPPWWGLEPGFAVLVQDLVRRMARRGIHCQVLEGYRSPARQTYLARSGRGVTRADAGESLHQVGLAADLAPMREGQPVLHTGDPWARAAYAALGQEAEALGLVWGGRWSFRDLGHVEAPHFNPKHQPLPVLY